ncbi:hypothetical protein, partial [Shigella flexneri]|uniref:hypothetical protein n=1 Tax=Shigella flexneri TaxID=623 RepID=UPI001C0A8DEC
MKLRSVASDKSDTFEQFSDDSMRLSKKSGKVKPTTLVQMRGATEKQCTHALFDVFKYIQRKLGGIPMTHIAIMLAISRVESPTNPFPAVGFDSEDADVMDGKRFEDHNTLIAMRSAV